MFDKNGECHPIIFKIDDFSPLEKKYIELLYSTITPNSSGTTFSNCPHTNSKGKCLDMVDLPSVSVQEFQDLLKLLFPEVFSESTPLRKQNIPETNNSFESSGW